jgi:hypothetical protein
VSPKISKNSAVLEFFDLQVCGARGAGGAAAQGVFLALRAHEVYMLVSFLPSSTITSILKVRRMISILHVQPPEHGELCAGRELRGTQGAAIRRIPV